MVQVAPHLPISKLQRPPPCINSVNPLSDWNLHSITHTFY